MARMHKPSTLLIAFAVLIALQGPLQWVGVGSIDGMMTGPDSFMRLHRVAELHATGAWYGNHDPHVNAPYGHALHWTRPLDVMLYAGAWLGTAFTGFRSALWIWGLAIGPVMMIAIMLMWSRITRPFLDDMAFVISLALLGFLPLLNGVFQLGRPDHHSLLLVLFIAQLAIFIRYARDKTRTRDMAVAGAICGLALWISVESLTHMLVFCSAIGIAWLARGGRQARDLAVYLASATIVVSLALIAERTPEHWLDVQYDRVSIVHWTLTFIGTVSWAGVYLGDRSTRFSLDKPRRLAAAAAGCVLPGLVMVLLFPSFFVGPFADIEGDGLKDLLTSIQEFQPLFPTSRYSGAMFVGNLGPVLLTLGYIAWRWRRTSADGRTLLTLWLLGLAVYVPLAVFQALRWTSYVQAVIWLPWSLMLIEILRGQGGASLKRGAAFLRPALMVLAVGAPPAIGLALLPATVMAENAKKEMTGGCDWVEMARYLSRTTPAPDAVLMTDFFEGPRLVWRTGYRVVGAPYNIPSAFEDTRAFFGAASDTQARTVAERRRLTLVLVCPTGKERVLYQKNGANSLFSRLGRGEPPPWLAAEPLPDALSAFRLYRVARP